MRTFTYKSTGSTEIQADVFRPDDSRARAVVVWIHGGALVLGSRESVPKDLLDLCRSNGHLLVSLDYRLAPEVKLPAIVEDIQDALRWVREAGPALFGADPGRVAVAGASAGGYLTMMAGACVDPPPAVLVAYAGYGDVDGDWYAKPSAHYRSTGPIISAEEAYRAVGAEVLTGTGGDTPTASARGRFYLYLRQNGLWTREVTGFEPGDARLDRYCPVRNISSRFPPIALVHGTADTDVPYEKATDVQRELARHGVEHLLLTVAGGDHSLSGGRDAVTRARSGALAFLRERLG